MAEMSSTPTRVVTGKVRLSYVHVSQPRAATQGAVPKYSVTLLIPKFDAATRQRIDAAIQAAILNGTTSKWNGQRPAQPAIPLYDGDGLRPTGERFSDECKGHWVMTASSEQKPEIVDINLNPIINATEIYSGMYARVSINFFAYFNSGKKGIGCGLNNIQKLEDGEPLAGRTNAADDFGAGTGYNPGGPVYGAGQAPAYPQQPVQPYAPTQPAYAPPAPAPAYPQYGQAPVYQQPPVQPPMYPQQPVQPYAAPTQPQPVQIDPITGRPITGGVMGI